MKESIAREVNISEGAVIRAYREGLMTAINILKDRKDYRIDSILNELRIARDSLS